MVPRLGIEPRFTASKAAVLPLDDLGVRGSDLFGIFRCRRFPSASPYHIYASALLNRLLELFSNKSLPVFAERL